jgi:putative transcriptional regulator
LQARAHPTDVDVLYDGALMDYSAGNLAAGPAFVVAAHLSLRPSARALVGVADSAGGSLLEELEPVSLASPAWLTEAAPVPATSYTETNVFARVLSSLDQGRWKRNLAGMLVKPVPGVAAQLLKLEAGRSVPHHGHHGQEFTLVLSGAFEDGHGIYRRGDLVVQDEEGEHQPCATSDGDCICLISQTAPVRLKGPLGWIVNALSS